MDWFVAVIACVRPEEGMPEEGTCVEWTRTFGFIVLKDGRRAYV